MTAFVSFAFPALVITLVSVRVLKGRPLDEEDFRNALLIGAATGVLGTIGVLTLFSQGK